MAEIAKIKGYDIRDKKLADATSQSTVAATDAIEMKTTSGDQVYITRDSFVQAMASVLNSNSQSTINQLFGADANGNHAAINMSNLAKTLGLDIVSYYNDGMDNYMPGNDGVYVHIVTGGFWDSHLFVGRVNGNETALWTCVINYIASRDKSNLVWTKIK